MRVPSNRAKDLPESEAAARPEEVGAEAEGSAPQVVIRPFRGFGEFQQWMKALAGIYERAYQELGKYAYRGRGKIYSYLLWLYRGDPGCFFVAWNERGEPVGFISAHRHWHDSELGEVGNIHEMDVDPAYQGRGIGSRLFRHMLDVLRQEHDRVMLWVGEENLRARRMYERFGFREVGRHGEWIKMAKDFSAESSSS